VGPATAQEDHCKPSYGPGGTVESGCAERNDFRRSHRSYRERPGSAAPSSCTPRIPLRQQRPQSRLRQSHRRRVRRHRHRAQSSPVSSHRGWLWYGWGIPIPRFITARVIGFTEKTKNGKWMTEADGGLRPVPRVEDRAEEIEICTNLHRDGLLSPERNDRVNARGTRAGARRHSPRTSSMPTAAPASTRGSWR